ncbi:acyltransferase family protein, partial [Streptomyces flavovirens]|uniref:acyltransferase family protein n=1 Tax=Streptomyces flavovirens TaxID=52258 RepID=UPI003D0E08C8
MSNIYFWRDANNYFDADATAKPLLHTWSLGVEEQFYLFFPILIVFLKKHFPDRAKSILASILLLSFALNVVGAYVKPSATFYLLPTRAWELLLGAMLALEAVPDLRSDILRQTCALL